MWIVGSTVAITATYLQIAADRSYFTDNLSGAAVGLGVGVLVPLLLHRRAEARTSGIVGGGRRWAEGVTLTSRSVSGGRVVGLGWAF